MSDRPIALKINRSKTVVRNFFYVTMESVTNKSTGRPLKLTTRSKRNVIRKAVQYCEKSSIIKSDLELSVTYRTVRNV